MRDIELEYRAEIPFAKMPEIRRRLLKLGRPLGISKRLSVMYFGKIGKAQFDIRVRITNGKAEVAVKKGGFHSSSRTETVQKIAKDQIAGFVRIFSSLGFESKISERTIERFLLKNGIEASLVEKGGIAYLELEKMSKRATVETNRRQLLNLVSEMKLNKYMITGKKSFHNLCSRFSSRVDHPFINTSHDSRLLARLLKKY
jgi:adenylate cyclase class IV